MNLSDIPPQLARYGYTLTAQNEIVTPSGKVTSVKFSVKKGRIQTRGSLGGLLWSGDDIGKFLEKYWYAKPLPEQSTCPTCATVHPHGSPCPVCRDFGMLGKMFLEGEKE